MSLIYESENASIYCGDAAEELGNLRTGSVDLLATDPPYGVGYQSNIRSKTTRHQKLRGDLPDEQQSVLSVLGMAAKKCGKSGHVYVFGIAPELLSQHVRLSATSELIWDKQLTTMGNLNSPWMQNHEKITFGMYASDAAQIRAHRGALSARKRQGSVLSVPRRNSAQTNRHPTEKPVELMSQLIESSTVSGDVVLDPFLGSGSTAVAAVLLGRRAIGIEIDPGYAQAAVDRIKAAEKLRKQVLAV